MLSVINLTVNGQVLSGESIKVASDLIEEITCAFTFEGDDWDGFDKISAIFQNKQSGDRIEQPIDNNSVVVPPEVLSKKGEIVVNLYAYNIDPTTQLKSIQMTSYKNKIIDVLQKVNVKGANSNPTPETWRVEFGTEVQARIEGDEVLNERISAIESKEADWDAKVEEAPDDGKQYARKNKAWEEIAVTSGVTSVNGKTGAVTLDANDIGADTQGSAQTVQDNLDVHIEDMDNPHEVTKSQVGLGNVDNTSDIDKPISTQTKDYVDEEIARVEAEIPSTSVSSVNGKTGDVLLNYADVGADQQGSANTVQGNLDTHIADSTNPHNVTKEQVGLDEVDNTSDADKPVSTATQNALNAKANTSDLNTHIDDTNNPHETTKEQVGLGNVDNVRQYSTTNPPPYPVTSVNAQTGAVELDYNDVGADASGSSQTVQANLNTLVTQLDNGTKVVAKTTSDADGNNIVNTYATKQELSNITAVQIRNIDAEVIEATIAAVQSIATNYISTYYSRLPKTYDGLVITMTDQENDKILYMYTETSSMWINVGINSVDLSNYVSVVQQTFSEAQKAQARANIGAGTSSFSGDYNDLTNKPTSLSDFTDDINDVKYSSQTLTELQKQQARANIGAGSQGDVEDLTGDVTQIKEDISQLESGKVGFTDYPTSTIGGVIKTNSDYATTTNASGQLMAAGWTETQYESGSLYAFIGKMTLENLINGGHIQKGKLVRTVTLLANGWNSTTKEQTVSCEGVTTDPNQVIYPSPSPDDVEKYAQAGIKCTAQGNGTLTFKAVSSIPTEAIEVGVVIL